MKALVLNDTKVVVNVFDDTTSVFLLEDSTQIGNPTDEVHFYIGFCNAGNSTLYENVTLPTDFSPQKYLFDGTDWAPNPNWGVPRPQAPQE